LYICKELVARQGGQIWAKSTPREGAVFCVTLPIFSLPYLIAPALRREPHTQGPISLVVTEIASPLGWLSDAARAEQSPGIRELLHGCLHSDLDILLPKMGSPGATELFFILAITDEIGCAALTKRIQERLDRCEPLLRASLTAKASYRALEAVKRNARESMKGFVERVAVQVQQALNEELSLRMVLNGQ
jgi:hypothetical protein